MKLTTPSKQSLTLAKILPQLGLWLAVLFVPLVLAIALKNTRAASSEQIKVTGALNVPRFGHTATLLTNGAHAGHVLIAGGVDATGNATPSAEVYIAANGAFEPVAPMNVPRAGHKAKMYPGGYVLISGGDAGNTSEMFDPLNLNWLPVEPTPIDDLGPVAGPPYSTAIELANTRFLLFGADAAALFVPETSEVVPLENSNPLHRVGATATELAGDKKVLVAGGVNSSNELIAAAALFNPAKVVTDKDDYQPGDQVFLSGTGWKPGEWVDIYVVDNFVTQPEWYYDTSIQADTNGDFVVEPFLFEVLLQHLGVTFDLTAIGQTSGLSAATKFTDARNVHVVTLNGSSSVVVSPGATISARVTVRTSGSGVNDDWNSTRWQISKTPPAPGTGNLVDHAAVYSEDGTNTETFNITAPMVPGIYNAYFVAYSDDTGATNASPVEDGTLAVSVIVVEGCLETAFFDNFNNVEDILHSPFIVPGWTKSGQTNEIDTRILDDVNFWQGIRYLRVRQGGTVTKTNISTAGLNDIHLKYKWGQEIDDDGSFDGALVVEWKLSSSVSWTTVNSNILTSEPLIRPVILVEAALGASAANTNIDIRFSCTGTDNFDHIRLDDVMVTGTQTTQPMITCPTNTTVACGGSTDPSNTGQATATNTCNVGSPLPWINEIHYAVGAVDGGADTNEFIEIAGKAGTDLSAYQLVLYRTASPANRPYHTNNLSGIIIDEGCGFGAIAFPYPTDTILNAADSAIALVATNGPNVIQFLSYEGIMTAEIGVASNMTSVNIGVFEDSPEPPANQSLQLIGTGNSLFDFFAWTGPTNASPGLLNAGQTISPCGGTNGIIISYSDVTNSGSITRTWIATDSSGNTNSCTQTITISGSSATCSIGGPNSVCSGTTNSHSGNADGGVVNLWTISGNGTFVGGVTATNGTPVDVVAGASGSYSLSLIVSNTASGGCTTNCTKIVSINPLPYCWIGGNTNVCSGTTNAYVAAGTIETIYLWTITGNAMFVGGSTNATGSPVNVVAGSAGSYTLSLTVSNTTTHCTSTCTKDVTVNASPICSIMGTNAVCASSTGHSYSGPPGMSTYSWLITAGPGTINGPTNGQNVTVDAGAAGLFTLQLTVSSNGCSSTCSQVVTNNALPYCNIVGTNAVCSGTTHQYSAAGAVVEKIYSWTITGNGTFVGGSTNATGSPVDVVAGAAGSYTLSLTVSNITTGCTSTCTKGVTVYANPTCSITGPPSVCSGTTNMYSAPPGSYLTRLWTISGSGTFLGGPTTTNGASVKVVAGASGSYTLSLIVSNTTTGCASSTCTNLVSVNPLPGAAGAITGPTNVTAGATNQMYSIALVANATGYHWTVPSGATITSGNGTNSIKVTWGCNGGNVTVTPTNSCGNGTSTNLAVTVQGTTSLLYLGSQIIVFPGTNGTNLLLKAQLSSSCTSCLSNKTIKFYLEVDPTDTNDPPATNKTLIATAITDGTGMASYTTNITSLVWKIEGAFTVTVEFEGDAGCSASKDDATLTIAQPGNHATGGGWYTLSGVGRVNFGFNVRAVPRSSPVVYKGHLLLINNGKWRLKGELTSFVQLLPNGACDGVGTLYYWDSTANAWVVSEEDVTFTISFTDQGTALKKGAKTTTPDKFGIHIDHLIVPPEPSPLPNSIPVDLKGGDISIKK